MASIKMNKNKKTVSIISAIEQIKWALPHKFQAALPKNS